MIFVDIRVQIVEALEASEINRSNITFHKDNVPRAFPAAMVILQGETGANGTSRRFTKIEYDIVVFLIVDVNNSKDPDADILSITKTFKENYKTLLGKDIPQIEYYSARADSSRKVRIAKLSLVSK